MRSQFWQYAASSIARKKRCVGWTLSRMGRKYFFWKNFFDRPIVVRCTSSRRECNACQFWAPNWDTNFERVLNVKNLAEANFNKFSWALCTSIVTFSFVRLYKYRSSITFLVGFRVRVQFLIFFINKVVLITIFYKVSFLDVSCKNKKSLYILPISSSYSQATWILHSFLLISYFSILPYQTTPPQTPWLLFYAIRHTIYSCCVWHDSHIKTKLTNF